MNRRGFFARVAGVAIFSRYAQAIASGPELLFQSSPITGPVRKLKAIWTCEAAQDLQCFHFIRADEALQQAFADVVKREQQTPQIESL